MMNIYLWNFVLNLLFVETSLSDVILSTSNDIATVGKDFNFTCSYVGFLSYVVLYRDDKYECAIHDIGACRLYDYNRIFNCKCNYKSFMLTIPGSFDIDTFHGSLWRCKIYYSGDISNILQLYVNVPITQVNITSTPNDINPTEVLSGSSQYFTCTTNAGRPSSRIQWYLSGANIANATVTQTDVCNPECDGKVTSSSVFEYTGNISDSGKSLFCTAKNIEGKSVRSINRSIDILYEPLIFNIPDYDITERNNLTITPIIDANPYPVFVWWTHQNGDSFRYNDPNLTISNIQRNSSGNYTCHAMNTITASGHLPLNRTSEETFYVNVQYSPLVHMEPSYMPFIVQKGKQNIRLICVVEDANPSDDIIYEWIYPAGTTRGKVLTITTVLLRHSGHYSCTATNSVGTSTSTRKQIAVHYEPVISGIQEYNIEAGRTLNVTPTVDAYPPPTSIWWTRQNNIKFIHYGLNLTIINIQIRDSDNYTCHVTNTLIPSGLSAQNRTSITVFNINVQKIPNEESANGAAIGVGMGFAVILLILGATSVYVFLYRKRRMTKRKENSNSKVYESELDKPRQTSGVDNHLYNELQDLKSDGKQQHNSLERCSNTYEEFGEVKSNANDNIYENMKISPNEIQIRQKDANLYVNLELKPSTRT